MPGIKLLFSLRGIDDIRVLDTDLDKKMVELKKEKSYPDFAKNSAEECYVKLSNVLEHLNAALLDAQNGKVNKKLLVDNEWHMRDVFPTVDAE